jgi:uncharacterized protein YrrD
MLRSLDAIRGFEVHAVDGHIGNVCDVCLDGHSWEILYLVLDTGTLFKRDALVPLSSSVRVDTSARRINLHITRAQMQRHRQAGDEGERPADQTVYRVRELLAYQMRDSGRANGHLEDVILDDETWVVRYLVIDTGAVTPPWAVRIDHRQCVGFLETQPSRPNA